MSTWVLSSFSLPFFFFCVSLLHFLYIHSSCRPSCFGQAGPDEAKEEEVEGEKEDEDRDYEGEEEEVEEGVDRLSNIKHRFDSYHLPWTPPLDVNLRHDVFATVLSTTSYTLSWNWSTIRSTPELPASISGSRPLSSNPSGYRTMAAASAMDFKSLVNTSTRPVTWTPPSLVTRPRTAFSKLALAEIRRTCKRLAVETTYCG
jgi:hypothetical protein